MRDVFSMFCSDWCPGKPKGKPPSLFFQRGQGNMVDSPNSALVPPRFLSRESGLFRWV